jgi:predicted glycogen debranching enzyme
MSNCCLESIAFGRETTGTLSISETQEWLVTNGIGGYGSGTVSGVLTRRYHGLLVAALIPPLGRTLLGTKLDEEVIYDGCEYPLSANRWSSQDISPTGYRYIEKFYLEKMIPTWHFACGDALIEKKIWMEWGSNTTYVHYKVLRACLPVKLFLKAIVNYRGYHDLTHAGNWRMAIAPLPKGLRIQAFDKATPFYLLSDKGHPALTHQWYHNYYLSMEKERGLDCVEDHLFAGTFQTTLLQGESLTLVISTEKSADLDGEKALHRRIAYQEQLIQQSPLFQTNPPFWIKQLLLAADQFIVNRPLANVPNGKTIIAGYPWFTDFGRDVMISLPGLTLATGRAPIAKEILQTFSQYVDQGMLPNRFPDDNEKPQYNTVDATLWYFDAIRRYFEMTKDKELIQELFPILVDIIHWHQKGTRYGIHVDPKDGLLHSGEADIQLTWMDVKIGDWVVTPRTGKAIEINALWFNALWAMISFAQLLGESSAPFEQAAHQVFAHFGRFWNPKTNYCFDVIDGPDGNDSSLRPNQLFAVSLIDSPLAAEQQKLVVEICARKLLTTHGLRSLSPDDPRYHGHYGGGPGERDSVYHQGTVWAWLLGPFCQAHLKVYKNPKATLEFLRSISFHLLAAGLGTCSEIFDGDAPMTPRGCIAQAWSVAQLLQAWQVINI